MGRNKKRNEYSKQLIKIQKLKKKQYFLKLEKKLKKKMI